nr:VOC family protein [Mycobacterium sp. IS-836]
MTSGVLDDVSFCHLVIGVTDMDRSLAFYRDVIGMEVIFETLISGEPFDAVLHAKRKQEGRVVGGLLGGLMVELLSLGAKPPADQPERRRVTGIHNVSLSVPDLDDTHRRITAAGCTPDQDPFEIGGCECFSSRTRTERRWSSSSCPAARAAPTRCTGACRYGWGP